MKLQSIISRRLRGSREGVDVAGDVNAVVSANVGELGPSRTHVSSRQRIVQRSGRPAVAEGTTETAKGGPDEPSQRPCA